METVIEKPAESVETGTQSRFKDGARFNFASDAKTFDCKFLEPGFVSYRDCGGKMELLRKETIQRCMDSIIGCPVTINHVEVTDSNRTEVENGRVNSWYYNSDDGWFYVKGTVDTEEAKFRINTGHRPSCGFQVGMPMGPGGMDHGIRYDQEILDLKFNHLAIVERPRYEGAVFRLNHIVSNPNKMQLFKFLKKLVTTATGADGKSTETATVQSRDISGDTEVVIDGAPVRLNELFTAHSAESAASLDASENDSFEIDGKTVTVGQLVASYKKQKARANAAPAAVAAAAAVPAETAEQKTAREADELAQRNNAAAIKVQGTDAFFTLHAARTAQKPEGVSTTNSGSLRERCAAANGRY